MTISKPLNENFPTSPPGLKVRNSILRVVCYLGFIIWSFPAHAGHSRSGYLDAGQSAGSRYVVTANRSDEVDKKGKRIDHRWTFNWHDRRAGKTFKGALLGLRSGTSDVFDPVNAHIFVAPDGETFAVWIPQAMARASTKKPADENRASKAFRTFAGFDHRLTIYKKTGELLKQFDVKDFLREDDWQWLYFYGCQVYWLAAYPELSIDKTPRAGYALYRISPDYTILEFRIGATAEATHHAKERGITPPEPRTVRVRLTDGKIVTSERNADARKIPVQPFVGELSNRGSQYRYVPSLDPVRLAGRYVEREKNTKPVISGQSSPPVQLETVNTKSQTD